MRMGLSKFTHSPCPRPPCWIFDCSFQAAPYPAARLHPTPSDLNIRLEGGRPRPPNARGQPRHAVARYRNRVALLLNLSAQLPTRNIPRNPMNVGSSLLDIGYSIALSGFKTAHCRAIRFSVRAGRLAPGGFRRSAGISRPRPRRAPGRRRPPARS